jgi:hypothetical protein
MVLRTLDIPAVLLYDVWFLSGLLGSLAYDSSEGILTDLVAAGYAPAPSSFNWALLTARRAYAAGCQDVDCATALTQGDVLAYEQSLIDDTLAARNVKRTLTVPSFRDTIEWITEARS